MTQISKLILLGLTRKNSNQKEANRLGLSLEEYKALKKEIGKQSFLNDEVFTQIDNCYFNKEKSKITEDYHDLDKGTRKLTGISTEEPQSPEEIIKLLNIDTSKWKLSQYWNKQQKDGWLISALVTKINSVEAAKFNFIEELLKHELPQYDLIPTRTRFSSDEKVCGVISLQDLHFDKPGNENLNEIIDKAILYLVGKAYYNYDLEKIILVIGADTLNMDTFDGTTTKGTPVENSELPTSVYIKAFDSLCGVIGKIKDFAKNVEVVFIPGNHDRLSSYHLVHALSQVFKLNPDIKFNIDYKERKVILYGQNMFAFEHSDVSSKNNPLVYAVEFPLQWGSTTNRILYTGHYHGRKTKEVITENEEQGFVSKMIPALTSSDYYHYHNKWTGNKRSAMIDIHDINKGLISEFVYNV